MTSYSTVQKQQLGQLGAYLQEKRQEQGKSLEDISLQTYIRAQLLKAVEAGDTSELPQPIFVQGFIRRYADALGLDGTNFSKQFPVHSIPDTPRPVPRPAVKVDMSYQTAAQKRSAQANSNHPEVGAMPINPTTTAPAIESVGASEPDTATEVTPTPEKVAAIATKEPALDSIPVSDGEMKVSGTNGHGISPSNGNASKRFSAADASVDNAPVGAMPLEPATVGSSLSSGSSNSLLDWLPWGIGAAVLIGAIALIGPRIFGGGNNEPAEPVEATAPQTEVAQPEPTVAPEPEPEPEPAISDAPVFLQVEITEAGPSWMSVIVDGEPVFEGLMDPGTTEIWEGKESITMNVGNAGAALISANGSEPQPAGNPGGAEFLTFNAEE